MTREQVKKLVFALFFILPWLFKPAFAQENKDTRLQLITSKNRLTLGEETEVKVKIIGNNVLVSAADIIINFDNSRLQAVEIIPSEFFSRYTAQKIDNQLGKVFLSGYSFIGAAQIASNADFATIRFKAIDIGKASIDFYFEPQGENDSNVASPWSIKDSLVGADGLQLLISNYDEVNNLSLPWYKKLINVVIDLLGI